MKPVWEKQLCPLARIPLATLVRYLQKAILDDTENLQNNFQPVTVDVHGLDLSTVGFPTVDRSSPTFWLRATDK